MMSQRHERPFRRPAVRELMMPRWTWLFGAMICSLPAGAAPVERQAWESTVETVRQNFERTLERNNELVQSEVRTREIGRLLAALPEGAKIVDWTGRTSTGVVRMSKVYEPESWGCHIAFASSPGVASIYCRVVTISGDGTEAKVSRAGFRELNAGDVVRVSGTVHWVSDAGLLDADPLSSFTSSMNVMEAALAAGQLGQLPDMTMIQARTTVVKPNNLFIIADAITIVPAPPEVARCVAAWDTCQNAIEETRRLLEETEQMESLLNEKQWECQDIHRLAATDAQFLALAKRWAPDCLDARYAPYSGPANPYDMYQSDHSPAQFLGLAPAAPDMASEISEGALSMVAVGYWWVNDAQDLESWQAAVLRARDAAMTERRRVEKALDDLRLLVAHE